MMIMTKEEQIDINNGIIFEASLWRHFHYEDMGYLTPRDLAAILARKSETEQRAHKAEQENAKLEEGENLKELLEMFLKELKNYQNNNYAINQCLDHDPLGIIMMLKDMENEDLITRSQQIILTNHIAENLIEKDNQLYKAAYDNVNHYTGSTIEIVHFDYIRLLINTIIGED